jgi:sigma-E factor negative regulatory protein RseB
MHLLESLLKHRMQGLLALVISITMSSATSAEQCPGADAAALSWLDKMSRSLHQVNYHGVVTLQRGDDMQVMQVSHSVEHGTSSEQLTRLTGQGAQVQRANHPLECIHPGHKLLRVGADLQAGRCGIAQYYRFTVGDGERVAGRQAVRISIEPLDMYRFGYIMELDRETGLLLKTQTVGRGEEILEKFQFANLSYTVQSPESVEVNVVHEAQHPSPLEQVTTPAMGREWTVSWVPLGFTATDAPVDDSARRTYTDGLAVFSVFLEELGRDIRPGEGLVRNGGTTSYTRGMSLTGQPVLVTVIGEVPVNTARMVADSVDWTQQDAD